MKHKKTIGAASVMLAMGAVYYFLGPTEEKPAPTPTPIYSPTPTPELEALQTPIQTLQPKQSRLSTQTAVEPELVPYPENPTNGYLARIYAGDRIGYDAIPNGYMVTLDPNVTPTSLSECVFADGLPRNAPCYLDRDHYRWYWTRCQKDIGEYEMDCAEQRARDKRMFP